MEKRGDIIILATGYKPQEVLVKKLFGDDVATRVGPIGGFGKGSNTKYVLPDGTARPVVYAGSFAQCRINSKYLTQIKAVEEGILPPHKPTNNYKYPVNFEPNRNNTIL